MGKHGRPMRRRRQEPKPKKPISIYAQSNLKREDVNTRLELVCLIPEIRKPFLDICKRNNKSLAAGVRLLIEQIVFEEKEQPAKLIKRGDSKYYTDKPYLIHVFPKELKRLLRAYCSFHKVTIKQLVASCVLEVVEGKRSMKGKEKGRTYWINRTVSGAKFKKHYYEE